MMQVVLIETKEAWKNYTHYLSEIKEHETS
jgi:hypothetical protein